MDLGRGGGPARKVRVGRLVGRGLVLTLLVGAVIAAGVGSTQAAGSVPPAAPVNHAPGPDSGPALHHDKSAPLSSIPPEHTPGTAHPAKPLPPGPASTAATSAQSTTAPTAPSQLAPSPSNNFDGLTSTAPNSCGCAPPDNEVATGTTQVVEIVNSELAVYSKTGGTLVSAESTNTLWSGFGGGCQTNNDGDATVTWDSMSQRWVIQQFSVSTTPYLDCVAISTSPDATGSYFRYSFQFSNFPDYPKLGVWSDGYYLSVNRFSILNSFLGPEMCALDRAAMLTGAAATDQCFTPSGYHGSVLPATLDGTTPPPSGESEWFVGINPSASNALAYFKFHVDWTSPSNSTLTGPTSLPVSPFSEACGGGTCIPQAGTTQKLDSLADRLMWRLAYRNFGDHEAMVVSHAVKTTVNGTNTVGMRWYELRPSGGALTVYQQGTQSPDGTYRWMGSIAMDQTGDIALGYSTSSGTLHPGIAYTGRLATDALGTMPQGETALFTGAGSQTTKLSRWGDYSEMSVDPADDCTFWYVNEYLPSNGTFNWHTRLGSFNFPGCGTTAANDFSISASPSSVSVTQGQSGGSTISTAVTSGSAQTVSLSASGLPSGATASFNPTSVTAGGSSALTITTSSSTPSGTYTVTITGTGTSATHTTTVSLTVNSASTDLVANGGFETGTFSSWSTTGISESIVTTAHSGSFAAELGASTATATGNSMISQTIAVPSGGATLSFWYQPHCASSGRAQMAIRSTTGTVLATPLSLCSNSGTWTEVSTSLNSWAGQSIVLVFNNNNASSTAPNYTFFDDISAS